MGSYKAGRRFEFLACKLVPDYSKYMQGSQHTGSARVWGTEQTKTHTGAQPCQN